jgi:hypothetical protein
MSSNTSDRRRIASSLILALMFLFADLALPQAVPEWNADSLEDEATIAQTTYSSSASKDTSIDSTSPNTNFGSDGTVDFGISISGESRILISFNNTVPTGEMVTDAILELTCGIDLADVDDIKIFSSRMKKSWDEGNATWNNRDVGVVWGVNGAYDDSDHDTWEPPFNGYGNNTFSINVTALVQDAVINSRSSIDLLLAAFGPLYTCHLSESSATTKRPSLEITHQNGTHANGGTLNPNFVADGAALMDADSFLLSAASNPELSWDSMTGVDAQVQLSLSQDFIAGADDTWYYNTQDNSTLFSLSAGTGSMSVPSGDELSNSTTMHYRMRSIDSTGTIGEWKVGYFHLPEHDVQEVGNYGKISIDYQDLGLGVSTIEETFIDSSNALKNTNMGSNSNMKIGSSSSSNQYGLIRLNMDDIGLHDNSTIISANMVMERVSYSGSADVSFHIMNGEDWTEGGVTWKKYDGTYYWDDGGRTPSMSVASFEGDQSSSTIEPNLTVAIQHWIDQNNAIKSSGGVASRSLELMMVASSWGIDETTSQHVDLCTKDASNCDEPYLEITYDWGSSSPTIPTHLTPLDGHSVWNQTGDNLSGNETPTLTWDGSIPWSGNMLMQLSTDSEYRDIIHSFDTSTSTEFAPSDGNWSISDSDALDSGVMYHWRMAQLDTTSNHHSWWATSSFLVSGLESEYLQDDDHRLRLSHGNATTAGDAPNCEDTYIDSGTPSTNYNGEDEMQVSYNTYPSETSILMGCDLTSHLLPDGYAVKTATLKMRLADYPSGSPNVAVWENRQHNWTEEGATWSSFDGSSSWGTSGAKGWERAGLQDSETLDSSYSAGDYVEFDITLAVQNAMREDRSADLIIGVLGIGSGADRDALFYPNHANSASRPEISFVYVPGSDALPADPVPQSPLNGSWSVDTGINPAPNDSPQLTWNYVSSGASVGGWSIELDTSSSFSSPDLLMVTSWTDTGFDITNRTYNLSSSLDTGETWHWRVRATSTTNQIGNWSNVFHFLLPDITTWSIDSDTTAIELHHREAMPSLNLPNFIDTWVADSGVGSTADQSSSSTFKVGTSTSGEDATGLLKIPLTELPNPQNAHISEAVLNLYAQFGSDVGNAISIHPALVSWNTSANGTTYDGTNNWSSPGAMGASDRGTMSDIQTSASADWMNFDVTELVQDAFANGDSHLSLMIVGSIDEGQTIFTSTDGNSNELPWLNLTWVTGNASTPEIAGSNAYPLNDEIIWDTSTHALLPGSNPSFTWNHNNSSNVDDWRIFIWNDYSDERAGWTMYDSRDSSTGWDVDNMTWTASSLSTGESFEWFVQPITDDILGSRGHETIFHIPTSTGTSINSTDANISLQEGLIVEALDYPAIFMDTYVDSGATNTAYESNSDLIMGRSNLTNSQNYYTETMVMVNWSSMPIPGNHEFVDASLTMYKLSGGQTNLETARIAICELRDSWGQNATLNGPNGAGSSWANPKCDVAFEITSVDYDDTFVEFDITYAVQHAHDRGDDMVNLMFYMVSDTTDQWHFASSDYTTDESRRPELTLTWRTGTQWLPNSPSQRSPADGSTIWNQTSSLPRGADDVSLNWSGHTFSNETRWVVQSSTSPRFTDENTTWLYDLTDNSTFNGTWDYSNLTYTTPENMTWGDYWMFWRVRAEQDHRQGTWSDVNSFRVPGVVGTDDGTGNNTVKLFHGSVFERSDALPAVPDATIDSSNPNSSLGNSGELNLGISAGGSGESRIIMTFDLSELPFPAAMTPTSALLSLYRSNVTGTSSLTVSAHACDTFFENSVTWNNAPSCSATEVTRSTLLVSPTAGWQVWDITSLAQSNIANNNQTLTVMLQSVGVPSSGHSFYDWNSNETLRPALVLDYVDNVDGVIPPAQPVLTYPNDGDILYNTSSWVLESLDKPQLTWNSVNNATGYIVTIASADGQDKYKSWESEEINGTTFTFTQDLDAGEVYSWWVQAINGSIPGPASSRSTFAIGSPVDHTYNGDHTWTYKFQTGNEVSNLGHTNIRDSYIGSGFADSNHGSESMIVGTGCEGVNTECRMILALDNDQIPLPAGAKIHSASMNLNVETPPSAAMTFSIHRLLTNSWTQSGSTWNSSQAGAPWGTAGMAAGVDYEASPISTTSMTAGATNVWLDIGHANMLIDGDHGWIIIGTSPTGVQDWVEFYSSENSQVGLRPVILVNYTDVHTVSISPSGTSTDADTQVQFSHILNNGVGGMVAEDVTWSTSSGSINSTGMFTPELVGTYTITACFGVICTTENITVSPGQATTLMVEDTEETITADQSFTIVATVVDQHGNIVPAISITYTESNGSMTGSTFNPYASGSQTVSVEWSGQMITVNIEVLGGIPSYYTTTGCEDVVKAGETCQLSWTLHDQFGNLLDLEDGGGITWNAGGGTFTEENGTYFATTVGSYNISMSSTGGISLDIPISVTHGAMAILEINASATLVTADDIVWLNTTRIDIMGNRLSVELPKANWTVSDGMITGGQPAEWHAQRRGTKTLTASYAGISNSVTVQVGEGAITGLILVIDSVDSTNTLQNITADDSITIKVKAHDADGNRWTVNVAWTIEHIQYSDQSVLQEMTYGSTTLFVPIFSSQSAYTLVATYTDENITLEVELDIGVTQGELVNVALLQPVELNQNIDADNSLQFVPQLTDSDGNIIDPSIITYTIEQYDSADLTSAISTTNITDIIVGNGGIWEASEEGFWTITAWAISESGYNISETVSITVEHGDAVSVDIDVIANTAKAGDVYTIMITGTDADGNTFPESVLWTQNNKAVPASTIEGSSGVYNWSATTAGEHTFGFRSPSGATSEWTVVVSAHQTVSRIDLTIADDKVMQLESFEIEVHTFDAWENEIPVPPETQVKMTGRMTAKAGANGFWTITTLDDSEQTVSVSVDGVEVSDTIVVEGTFMGFFESGGTLYYAGGILGILVVLVLLVVIVMVLRSGNSEYDDDDEDDDYEYEDETEKPAAVGPTGPGPSGPGPGGPGPSGPPPSQPVMEDWMEDHRIDDDGTEWAEDENGTWWYREPGTSDWAEWAD